MCGCHCHMVMHRQTNKQKQKQIRMSTFFIKFFWKTINCVTLWEKILKSIFWAIFRHLIICVTRKMSRNRNHLAIIMFCSSLTVHKTSPYTNMKQYIHVQASNKKILRIGPFTIAPVERAHNKSRAH